MLSKSFCITIPNQVGNDGFVKKFVSNSFPNGGVINTALKRILYAFLYDTIVLLFMHAL